MNNRFIIKPITATITKETLVKIPRWKEVVLKWLQITPERQRLYEASLYFLNKPEVRKHFMLYEPYSCTGWMVTNVIGNRADIVILEPTKQKIKHISEFAITGSSFSEF